MNNAKTRPLLKNINPASAAEDGGFIPEPRRIFPQNVKQTNQHEL